ncbi:MAG: GT4 family glycosyltransferase PelF [Planctomycetota bacterium]|nr:GT4 family glycosyltransferase PelF [Planctomycetota bacterium]
MTADVCLVLEGTYPYVPGGVSAWVHTLVTSLPDLTFHILHLSAAPGSYPKGMRYEMPSNVVGLDEVHLQTGDEDLLTRFSAKQVDEEAIACFADFFDQVRAGDGDAFAAFFDLVNDPERARLMRRMLLQSQDAWDVMVAAYREEAPERSFLRFVWTWRFAFLPLFNALAAPVPDARCFHTVCTGYSGILAAGAKAKTGRPMILTEHGIYTRERRIDIQSADWIPDHAAHESLVPRTPPFFRAFWMRQFEVMSRICYESADGIFTLYEGNRRLQIGDGADKDLIRIVVNGIDLERYGNAPADAETRDPNAFTIGFIGRVCPIKDVRTLLQSMRLVVDELPHARLRICGPLDEAEYVDECRRLTRTLRLEQHVVFEGLVDVPRVLGALDLCVLSSISEAQPLTILEVGARGIPVVATDVGACSELLGGRTPEDRALGDGGLVVPMATPGAMARALVKLARDEELCRSMGAAMRQRVQRFYDVADMVREYGDIYRSHVEAA